jgi:hypothetical protein
MKLNISMQRQGLRMLYSALAHTCFEGTVSNQRHIFSFATSQQGHTQPETKLEGADWIYLARDRGRRRVVVNMVMHICVP